MTIDRTIYFRMDTNALYTKSGTFPNPSHTHSEWGYKYPYRYQDMTASERRIDWNWNRMLHSNYPPRYAERWVIAMQERWIEPDTQLAFELVSKKREVPAKADKLYWRDYRKRVDYLISNSEESLYQIRKKNPVMRKSTGKPWRKRLTVDGKLEDF